MRVIDIASHQAGFAPEIMDCEGIIIKATEGVTYVNPFWRDWADRTLASGKKLGLYHYSDGGEVTTEARFFLNTVKDYIGKAVLVLDWEEGKEGEAGYNPSFWMHGNWTGRWLRFVEDQTGVAPWLYLSAGVKHLNEVGYKFWIAQYSDSNPTGWQGTPWNDGIYSDCVLFQYTSHGRIPGYDRDLDLSKAYITADEWDMHAGKTIEEDAEMVFSFQPEGDKTAYIYENGIVYALDQLDELKAWRMVHKAATGKELPHINDIDPSWCAKESPYWKRFADSLGHQVTLKGFGK